MTKKLPLEVKIIRGAKRLLNEKGWTQASYAEDSEGNSIYWDSKKAVCFCVSGALYRSAHGVHYNCEHSDFSEKEEAVDRVFELMGDVLYGIDVPFFNDNAKTTKEKVISVLDTVEERILKGQGTFAEMGGI
jgi:hypothetical protein